MGLELIFLYLPLLVLIAVLGVLVVTSRAALWRKHVALACVLLTAAVGFVSFSELLGRPKPLTSLSALLNELGREADPVVIAAVLNEGEAIYLWLRIENELVPRAFVLPWDEEAARTLFKALKKRDEREGRDVRMRRKESTDGTDDYEPFFYEEPQEPLPPKELPPLLVP